MKYFTLQELVAPELLAVLSEESAWRLVPEWARSGLDALRHDHQDSIFINGTFWGTTYKYSGVRPLNCMVGAKYSRHKGYKGRLAFDLKTSDLDALLRLVEDKFMVYGIHQIENPSVTPGWLHVEFSMTPSHSLEIFDP